MNFSIKSVMFKGFMLSVLLIFSACQSSKKVTETDIRQANKTTTTSPETVVINNAPSATIVKATEDAQKSTTSPPLSIIHILEKMTDNEVNADWLAGDVDADYEGKPMSISASMTARFRRDSIIWLNVRKLGFNIARAKITPDSIFVINYIQSSYIAQDLKHIEKKYNIPADFKVLQNILLGNPVFLTNKNQLKLEKNADGEFILRGSDEQWQNTYRINAQDFSVKEMVFEQPISERFLKISYESYSILKGYGNGQKKFPYIRTLNMESPQTGKISITLEVDADGLEVNVPKNIKFEIPSHYSNAD